MKLRHCLCLNCFFLGPISSVLIVIAYLAWIPVQILLILLDLIRGIYKKEFNLENFLRLLNMIGVAVFKVPHALVAFFCNFVGMSKVPYMFALKEVGDNITGGENLFLKRLMEVLPWSSGEADKLIQMARFSNIRYVGDKTQMKDNETSEELHARENSASLHNRIKNACFEFAILLPHLKKYKESGGDLNAVNFDGQTVLNALCSMDVIIMPKCVEWMLQQGANPNLLTSTGLRKISSALNSAVNVYQKVAHDDRNKDKKQKALEVVQLLLEHDATDMNLLVSSSGSHSGTV